MECALIEPRKLVVLRILLLPTADTDLFDGVDIVVLRFLCDPQQRTSDGRAGTSSAGPALHLIRRLAVTPAECQFTTAITVGELIYGAVRRRNAQLSQRVQHLIHDAGVVLPFDEVAAHTYGDLRAMLEQAGQPLAESDLRIASIALANELMVVTGNVHHFDRVPGLAVENWLEEP